MKILLLRNTIADGRPVSAGQAIEVSESVGQALIVIGKARLDAPQSILPEKYPVVDANDGVTPQEISEAGRVLREAADRDVPVKKSKKAKA